MAAVDQVVGGRPDAGWDVLASDGAVVGIRPLREDDEPALEAMNQRVSDRSIYLRFFGISRASADEQTHHLVRIHDGHVALVAEYGGQLVGVASYEPLRTGEAEMAFLVEDSVHGRGIGTLLLEQLAAVARENGVRRLRADTLVENAGMLRVFAGSGFDQVRSMDSGVVELVLDTAYRPSTLERMADRERGAEDRSLQRLFSPRAVAVVSAGRTPGGIGHEVLRNIVKGNFTGCVYAVNPHAEQVAEVPSYPSVVDVPGVVDLAVIAVPAEHVRQVLSECGSKGVRGAVVLTAGFSEAGTAGPELQRDILEIARRHSIRLIGPNCLGLVNTDSEVRLNATFAEVAPTPGSLAIAAQSGAVGLAVLDQAARTGLGISEFVSLGDKLDVSGNDLLLHWWGDPRTTVIGLYLESFGNPRKFGGLARLVGRTKPILVVKGGRSAGGRRPGASHTAATTTPETAVDALFTQSGVLRMETVEELVETARVLAVRPLPRGRRIAVVGNAGGAGVLAADAAGRLGLELPELSEAIQRELAAVDAVGCGNPVDLGAAASPKSLARALKVIVDSGEVDAVLVCCAATRPGRVEDIYDAIAGSAVEADLPIVVNCVGAPRLAPEVVLADGRRLPVFPFPENAVRAMTRAVRYAEWRSRPQGVVPELPRVDAVGTRAVVRRFLEHKPHGGWLESLYVGRLLQCAGVPAIPVLAASGRSEAIAAAESVGYPVAVKTAASGVLRKTDIGGVRVGLANSVLLATAYDEITAAAGDPQVVVQAMAPSGTELVIGVVRDHLFGPMLMAGSGGILTDLLADRQWRGLPLTDLDATDMVHALRCAPLLAGYRGAQAADREAVLDVIHRIAWLAELVPELAELDINPLIAGPSGAFAVDARMRLTPTTSEPDWHARRMRAAGA
ncbi:acyl-CoA synthetase (NDP forming)/GNAT superfamily N-acetyltransferase [Kribbella aluminosa]|uniref:Acyl-CoA synthetase (NDP forming)/GNAT superfamily N-acetyltransferase n=1 Tax=Kribbella aluminosa TaxID=416017 RepID=A0ABS4ULT3_9ACTN|nr:bifunctional GNAT family N-acetyltransferase/acetate--CoA ligase family protein [Kribbella aluminosa]MBP2352592.1 acyl-CoA synthetase (NDP forming)/GNAT superfamily N-acetyltransferase [Kribbella aluminosa]